LVKSAVTPMVSGASGEAVPGTERDHVGGNAGGAEAFAIGNDGRSGFMARRRDDVVDVLVGRNIRILRKQRRMSQTDLANKIGVTFQQVQKSGRKWPAVPDLGDF
jgi:hypothetical protein